MHLGPRLFVCSLVSSLLVACPDSHGEDDAAAAVPDAAVTSVLDAGLDAAVDAAVDAARVVASDAGNDARADAIVAPDASVTPIELAVGGDFTVTSDDQLAFERDGAVWVVSLDGGEPERIAEGQLYVPPSRPPTPVVWVRGREDGTPTRLVVWTAAAGVHVMTEAFRGPQAASVDGRFIAYGARGASGDYDLHVAATDGSIDRMVDEAVASWIDDPCIASPGFVREWLLYEHCGRGGMRVEAVRASGESYVLGGIWQSWQGDETTGTALFEGADGVLTATDLETGVVTELDDGVGVVWRAENGVAVYVRRSGDTNRLCATEIARPVRRELATSAEYQGLSFDGAWVAFYEESVSAHDLFVASTDGASPPRMLEPAIVFGYARFTRDSRFAFYSTTTRPRVAELAGAFAATLEVDLTDHRLAAGSGLLVLDRVSVPSRVVLYALPSTEGRELARDVTRFEVDASGDRLVYQRRDGTIVVRPL